MDSQVYITYVAYILNYILYVSIFKYDFEPYITFIELVL